MYAVLGICLWTYRHTDKQTRTLQYSAESARLSYRPNIYYCSVAACFWPSAFCCLINISTSRLHCCWQSLKRLTILMYLPVKDWHKSSTFLKQGYRFEIALYCFTYSQHCLYRGVYFRRASFDGGSFSSSRLSGALTFLQSFDDIGYITERTPGR